MKTCHQYTSTQVQLYANTHTHTHMRRIATKEHQCRETVNGVLGMVKYAAARSGSKYVVGREGWKSMVVN